MSKSPTIHDLAADLNISATTVWRALNDRERVSAKTRERVRERAKAINYAPSLVAQNLSHGRTSTLGIIVPRVGNPVFSTMVEVVEQVAYERGYCVIVCNVLQGILREAEYTRMLYRRRVEGAVIVPFGQNNPDYPKDWDSLLDELGRRAVPVVLLEQGLTSNRFPAVVGDNYGAAYDMTQYLINLGHKSIALISSTSHDHDPIWQERLTGFKQAMADAGLTDQSHLLLDAYVPCDGHQDYQPELIKKRFDSPNRPTAAFVLSDLLAVRVMKTLRQIGLEIPRDVSVAGFDNTSIAEHAIPPLTSVQQPTEIMARRATEILFSQIENKGDSTIAAAYERLPCQLVIRESCAPPPAL